MFIKRFDNGEFIVLLFYTDDMLIVGHDQTKIGKLKESLNKSFVMKNLGPVK